MGTVGKPSRRGPQCCGALNLVVGEGVLEHCVLTAFEMLLNFVFLVNAMSRLLPLLCLLLASCLSTPKEPVVEAHDPNFLYYFIEDVEAERLSARDYEKMNDVYQRIGYDRARSRALYRRRDEEKH